MRDVGPYDHIQDGDIVEISDSTGFKELRRWEGTDDVGRATWHTADGSIHYSVEQFNIRLVCRKENEEKHRKARGS